ncbi:serine/threonine protein kinase OSK1-like [Prosopis cineraria]|uniref:serine/threonine protein kinase OSK1-like n=1 Tax=Prosopis cineraria TaxID=364024 RepID=UPI00240EDBFB|nr:serine/threonine protein kinase OSK1-like [Prosopis cineraria]
MEGSRGRVGGCSLRNKNYLENYMLGKKIGQGSFSKVKMAEHVFGKRDQDSEKVGASSHRLSVRGDRNTKKDKYGDGVSQIWRALPLHLSQGCLNEDEARHHFQHGRARDLVARMLEVDPIKRITISDIRRHPWFLPHLPSYLAVAPPDTAELANKIDDEILEQVVSLGFDKNQVVDSLNKLKQNEATTVVYHLMVDNQLQTCGGYLRYEFEDMLEVTLPP